MPTDQEPTKPKPRILPRLNNPDRTGGEEVTLENIIGQAIGAASVCWENMTGAGVFDSSRARQILDDPTGERPSCNDDGMTALENLRAYVERCGEDCPDDSEVPDQHWTIEHPLTVGDLRRVEAEVKAEALRETADRIARLGPRLPGSYEWRLNVAEAPEWLRQLADATEAGHPAGLKTGAAP